MRKLIALVLMLVVLSAGCLGSSPGEQKKTSFKTENSVINSTDITSQKRTTQENSTITSSSLNQSSSLSFKKEALIYSFIRIVSGNISVEYKNGSIKQSLHLRIIGKCWADPQKGIVVINETIYVPNQGSSSIRLVLKNGTLYINDGYGWRKTTGGNYSAVLIVPRLLLEEKFGKLNNTSAKTLLIEYAGLPNKSNVTIKKAELLRSTNGYELWIVGTAEYVENDIKVLEMVTIREIIQPSSTTSKEP